MGIGSTISEELDGADFGDARLTKRLKTLGEGLSASPALSLPRALDAAELEAAYRFFRNDAVTPSRILEPHISATTKRVAAKDEAIAVHDTTIMSFGGDGDRNLGPVHTVKQGFLAHFTLALAADETRRPLGILGLQTIVRSARKRDADAPRESARWWSQIEETDRRVNARSKLVHVMDREADDYVLFARLVEGSYRFVVRLAHDRLLATEDDNAPRKVLEALENSRVIATREVPIARRGKGTAPKDTKVHPPRAGRMAKLAVSAMSLALKKPRQFRSPIKGLPRSVSLNVVYVREVEAPENSTPVTWMLLTSDAIDTPEQILAVVDRYRARWTIEEYFKALKTGCAYESRQLESAHSLFNALALFAPIAWQVMSLRSEARDAPDTPASNVFEAITLRVLLRFSRIKLSAEPSTREAMLAVAALGGHLKHNGDPGWQSLWAGYTKLVTLVEGWRAANDAPTSDQ